MYLDAFDGEQNASQVSSLVDFIDSLATAGAASTAALVSTINVMQNLYSLIDSSIEQRSSFSREALYDVLDPASGLSPDLFGNSLVIDEFIDLIQEVHAFCSISSNTPYHVDFSMDSDGNIVSCKIGSQVTSEMNAPRPGPRNLRFDPWSSLYSGLSFVLEGAGAACTAMGAIAGKAGGVLWSGIGAVGAGLGFSLGYVNDVQAGETPSQAFWSNLGGLVVGVGITVGAGIVLGTGLPVIIGAAVIGGVANYYTNKAIDKCFTDALAVDLPRDPFVLDLDGDGIETLGTAAGILFDHNGDGVRRGTGWLKGDDGFLVFDRNNDGVVNNGGELFGDQTKRYDGLGNCTDAFDALGQEDTNGDGVINNLDENWSKLQVWRDLNQDGKSQANELFTLDELGIEQINLDKKTTNSSVAGGTQSGQGTYVKTDGTVGITGQLDFDESMFYREFPDRIEIPEGNQNLPNVGGSGALRDLLEAASADGSVERLLREIAAGETRREQMEVLDSLLYAWANTSGFYTTVEERIGARYPGYEIRQTGVPNGDVAAWNRILHIVEAFNGRYFVTMQESESSGGSSPSGDAVSNVASSSNFPWYVRVVSQSSSSGAIALTPPTITINWDQRQVDLLLKSYEAICDYVYKSIAIQTRFAPIFELAELAFDVDTQQIGLCLKNVEAYFADINTADLDKVYELCEFSQMATLCNIMLGWKGFEQINDIFNTALSEQTVLQICNDLKINRIDSNYYNRNGSDGTDFIMGGIANDLTWVFT